MYELRAFFTSRLYTWVYTLGLNRLASSDRFSRRHRQFCYQVSGMESHGVFGPLIDTRRPPSSPTSCSADGMGAQLRCPSEVLGSCDERATVRHFRRDLP